MHLHFFLCLEICLCNLEIPVDLVQPAVHMLVGWGMKRCGQNGSKASLSYLYLRSELGVPFMPVPQILLLQFV